MTRSRVINTSLISTLGLLSLLLAEPAMGFPGPLLDASGLSRGSVPFPIPPDLEPAVRFWTALFTQHGSDRVVLHDREYMEIVWQVVELPRDDEGKINERETRALIRRTTEDLRTRLRRLEKDPTPSDEEDRILLSLAGGHDRKRLKGAWLRVRAQRGVADRFRDGLVRARKWHSQIQEILAKEKVPPEIAALPFVESMFNASARSSAGAAGLWQLMPATARGLGLTVRKGKDQRLDPLTATRAAAKMLKQNYRMLGKWPLAITAYNHGPNGVRRAVKAVGSTDLAYLIEHYEKSTWGFASKNFYAEFLAAMAVFSSLDEQFASFVNAAAQANRRELVQ